jgi:DNA-binding NarL/FixJ family response regulator
VLADDHPIVREGIRSLVNAQPDMKVVAEAEDGVTACRRVAELRPDVAVLDISMPGVSGIEAAERMRTEAPETRVLVLTVHEDRGYVSRILEAGAAGYVVKRTAADALVRAIRAVAAGGVYLDPAVAGGLVERMVHSRRATPAPGAPATLSDREAEVTRLVARGFTNKEIAARLGIRTKTVESYKARIAEKLEIRTRADLVRFAMQQGWLTEE